jgi:hypothetical protein
MRDQFYKSLPARQSEKQVDAFLAKHPELLEHKDELLRRARQHQDETCLEVVTDIADRARDPVLRPSKLAIAVAVGVRALQVAA